MLENRGYFTQRRPEMVEFVPERRTRTLEIGCAQGDFLQSLPGIEEAWGIEPSPSAEIARARLNYVFELTYDAAERDLPCSYFDLIVCNDVIEHMPDHDSFFARIGKHLAPNGVIMGSIPNVRFYSNLFGLLFEKDWQYRDAGILDRTHTRFFTEKSLKACLSRHGFVLNRFKGLTANISMGGSSRDRMYFWLSRALVHGTFGSFSDIQYLQFGFQASFRDKAT